MSEENSKKIDAEIAKLLAETAKINNETMWYPMVVVSGLFIAIGAVIKFIL
jgi:disulfide oxidoreductase YuzD